MLQTGTDGQADLMAAEPNITQVRATRPHIPKADGTPF
jgi:hypothetical protein